MNTADPIPSVAAAALVLVGAGHYFYNVQFSDAGMLQRARSVLHEIGSQSSCDGRGASDPSGESDCWSVAGYTLVKDKDGLFRIYGTSTGKTAALGGVRKGVEGVPEVFVDRALLEKAVEVLEAAEPADSNVRYVISS